MKDAIERVLQEGVAEAIGEEELRSLLEKNTPLIVKLGVDPTSTELHLGHALPLWKLRQFQDMGHKAVLVIGDFTASIGDPAGKNKTRPVLAPEIIEENMRNYVAQAHKILDPTTAVIVHNSEWLREMKLADFIGYAMQVTINSLIERDDFSQRLHNSDPVSLHEVLYPVIQGIDSVHLEADVELGGWDQRLNFLTARELQRKCNQRPQSVVMMKPLLGLDGLKKMSKSYDNYIALTDSPEQMFGKVMSAPDSTIDNFAELAAWMSAEERQQLNRRHPREAKADVAFAIVQRYYDPEAAREARSQFDQVFKDKKHEQADRAQVLFPDEEVTVIQAVTKSLKESSSQAQRIISQNGVRVNGAVKNDPREKIFLSGKTIMQIGKHRFFELRWEK